MRAGYWTCNASRPTLRRACSSALQSAPDEVHSHACSNGGHPDEGLAEQDTRRFSASCAQPLPVEEVQGRIDDLPDRGPSTGLFGLAAGRLSVEIAPSERGPYLAFFAEPGEWVGYRGVMTGLPRDTNLKATRCSELLFLPNQAIEDLVYQDPKRWRIFCRVSLADLKRVTSLLDDVLRRDHVQRIIATLLHFSGCRAGTPRDATPIELDVGQEEVSRIANIGRTATGAVLRDLEKAGHIELAYRRIHVLAPDALRAQLSEN